jgi:hypothetical protein
MNDSCSECLFYRFQSRIAHLFLVSRSDIQQQIDKEQRHLARLQAELENEVIVIGDDD